jgi:hypothetical protein
VFKTYPGVKFLAIGNQSTILSSVMSKLSSISSTLWALGKLLGLCLIVLKAVFNRSDYSILLSFYYNMYYFECMLLFTSYHWEDLIKQLSVSWGSRWKRGAEWGSEWLTDDCSYFHLIKITLNYRLTISQILNKCLQSKHINHAG